MKFGTAKSLGTKTPEVPQTVEGKRTSSMSYDTIMLDAKDFPKLAGMDNGDKCKMLFTVQKEGQRLPSNWDRTKAEKITIRLTEASEEKAEEEESFRRKQGY